MLKLIHQKEIFTLRGILTGDSLKFLETYGVSGDAVISTRRTSGNIPENEGTDPAGKILRIEFPLSFGKSNTVIESVRNEAYYRLDGDHGFPDSLEVQISNLRQNGYYLHARIPLDEGQLVLTLGQNLEGTIIIG